MVLLYWNDTPAILGMIHLGSFVPFLGDFLDFPNINVRNADSMWGVYVYIYIYM